MKAHSVWSSERHLVKGVRAVVKLWPTNGMRFRRLKSGWHNSGHWSTDYHLGQIELERRIIELGI